MLLGKVDEGTKGEEERDNGEGKGDVFIVVVLEYVIITILSRNALRFDSPNCSRCSG